MINIANLAPIIGGNGAYDGDYTTTNTYSVTHVTNGQNAAPDNNTGSITEPSQDGSFWLGPNAATTSYFVLDLGTAQTIGSFQLFNTRNGPYDDRGTGSFQITGANSVTNLGATGSDVVGGTVLASGTLTAQTYPGAWGSQGNTPLVPDVFASNDVQNSYRYLRFDALSIGAAADKGFGLAGVGLNEFRAFAPAPVPEPASFALFGLGAVGLFAVSRRHFR